MCSASSPIFGIFYTVFGVLLKGCCAISGNYYLIALFIFTLIMQIILFPLAIKQQKSQVKQAKMRPKEMLIREKYSGRKDRATQQKMNMEVQELYRNEGHSPFAGCLPLLIQLPIILILYGVIRMPLTYTTSSNVEVDSQYQVAVQILDKAAGKTIEYQEAMKPQTEDQSSEVSDVSAVSEASAEQSVVSETSLTEAEKATEDTKTKLDIFLKDYTEMMKAFGATVPDGQNHWDKKPFKGNDNAEFALTEFILNDWRSDIIDDLIEIGKSVYPEKSERTLETEVRSLFTEEDNFNDEFVKSIPKFTFIGSYTLLDTPSRNGFSWLVIIPILVFITSFLQGVVTKKLSVQPATADGKQPGGGFMKWGLPLISTYFAWASFPAAVGVYWVYRTVFGIGQSYLLAKMYPLPVFTAEELAELKKQVKAKKKKVITIEVDEDDDTYDGMIITTDKSGKSSSGKSSEKGGGRADSPDTNYEMLSTDDEKDTAKSMKAPMKEDNPPPKGKDGDDGDAES